MPGLTNRSPASGGPPDIHTWLQDMSNGAYYDIGYPRATDLPYPELGARLAEVTLVNIGDPWDINGHIRHHSKAFERHVVELVGDLISAPPTRWGFVTTGSSAAIEHAITSAAYTFGDQLTAYASTSAHGCIAEICARYRLPLVTVRAAPRGSIDILDLHHQLDIRRHRPAIIIATLGTTWGDAIDDLAAINRIICELAFDRLHLHADAALAGIPLALLPEGERPLCTFAEVPAMTSWSTSGHKFLGVTQASAVIVYRQRPHRPTVTLPYTGAANPTAGCSRSGALPIELWHQLTRIPLAQHHQRAQACRQLASHAYRQLSEAGWPCWVNPHGFSVVLQRPPEPVLERWGLSHQGKWSQVKIMPGMGREQLDAALDDFIVARDIGDDEAIRTELGIGGDIGTVIAARLASL